MTSEKDLNKNTRSEATATSSDGGTLAVPLTIDGVSPGDPLQLIPESASLTGATLRIPLWLAPSITPGNSDLLEIWVREPGATTDTLFYSNRFFVPVTLPPSFLLPAQYLQVEGEIFLTYRVQADDFFGNPDTSVPQGFTVRPPVPVNLLAPEFTVDSPKREFELYKYLNCHVEPRIWVRITLHIPAQPGRFAANDQLTLTWEGFYNLNTTDPIPGTRGEFIKILSQAEATSATGFDFIMGNDKWARYIEPVTYGSVKAFYTLRRNGIALGRSRDDDAKVDRRTSGGAPCDESNDSLLQHDGGTQRVRK